MADKIEMQNNKTEAFADDKLNRKTVLKTLTGLTNLYTGQISLISLKNVILKKI